MRLDRIDLLRYGHFANRSIELPVTTPDYSVIYGDNEAGKSTLLRRISSLFFGVPARTVDVHSCKTSELRIGATISDGEKTLSLRRRKGTSGTLLNLDDGQLPESLITGFLREPVGGSVRHYQLSVPVRGCSSGLGRYSVLQRSQR